jgi:hypothetical protein
LSANDEADLGILAALEAGAADWLVSEDNRLRRRAVRAGLRENVFSVYDAVQTLRGFSHKPIKYPSLTQARGPQLNMGAHIFQGIREDYPEFDSWWRTKVCADDRPVLVVGELSNPQGVSVLKIESDEAPHGLQGRVLKICTFKVDELAEGSRRGELLLSGSLEYARSNACGLVYVEVLPRRQSLKEWAKLFGFSQLPDRTTTRGEIVLFKDLRGSSDTSGSLSALKYNIAHGPGRLVVQNPTMVPIQVHWRRRLLPELELQPTLFPIDEPCGNAIRKAYLCNAPIRSISEGDTLLFYETDAPSGPHRRCRHAVVSLGVVESTLVSTDPSAIVRLVGNRTVYPPKEIHHLCSKGEVLAIKFRHDRVLKAPWGYSELVAREVLKGPPRTIMTVKGEGVEWIRATLAE